MCKIPKHAVQNALEQNNIYTTSIKELTGGSNHYVFSIQTERTGDLIVKFPKIRETEKSYGNANKDTLFGGRLSLQREIYLLDKVRKAGLPSPKALLLMDTDYGQCIVMERTPGHNLMDYMEYNHHSLRRFLMIMGNLGNHMRNLHRMRFPSFGNIMCDAKIEPDNILNFADRYQSINHHIMKRCLEKGGLTQGEYHEVSSFFDSKFDSYRQQLDIHNHPATLVITDLHGDNFFIDNHKISGYFDVESAQAAPMAFELYSLRFFVFNYYGEKEYRLAEKSFWEAYYNHQQDAPDPDTNELIDFFSACRLMEIYQSYWGHIDGLRDTWGQRIKEILFHYIDRGHVDYLTLGAIWRERDRQPLCAVDDR